MVPSVCPPNTKRIAGGTFTTAWVPGGSIAIAPFCMDENEVTAGEYAACLQNGTCSAPNAGCTNVGVAGRENHPANCVDWNQAKAFCVAAGKRLPTEAEWEWAARGGPLARKLPWGDADPSAADAPERLCWSGKAPAPSTCPVGSFRAGDTVDGLHDMAGNVWELVDGDYRGKSYRGASFHTHPGTVQETHTDYRDGSSQTNRGVNIGFRCAGDVQEAATSLVGLRSGLAGYWPFDGSAADQSGNGHDLTLIGSPSFAAGHVGQALDLHGNAAQYGSRTASDAAFDFGSDDFSIQIWVNYHASNGEQTLLEKFTGTNGPGWTVTSADNTRALFFTPSASVGTPSTPGSLVAGTWHHVVVVRAKSQFWLMYDGVRFGPSAAPSIPATTNPLLVGRRNAADGRGGFPVNGLLDEVAIWSRALTDDEVSALYAGGAGVSLR